MSYDDTYDSVKNYARDAIAQHLTATGATFKWSLAQLKRDVTSLFTQFRGASSK